MPQYLRFINLLNRFNVKLKVAILWQMVFIYIYIYLHLLTQRHFFIYIYIYITYLFNSYIQINLEHKSVFFTRIIQNIFVVISMNVFYIIVSYTNCIYMCIK